MKSLTLERRRPRARKSVLKEPLLMPQRRAFPKDLFAFSASFCFFLGAAYLLAFQFKYSQGDALNRTYSAFAAVYSASPHLAAVGFVWPPLPTLLQLPLVIFKPLLYYGFAAMILTSLFGAGTVVALERLYRHYSFGFRHRLALALLFASNPFILYYAANGMSEMFFIFFFTLALCFFIVWRKVDRWPYVVLTGVAIVLSFFARYDAMALAAAMLAAIFFTLPRMGKAGGARMEATLLSYTTIVSYGLGIWVFLNWLIMGDPFYFYRSEYSNLYVTRFVKDRPEVVALQESLLAIPLYAIRKLSSVSPFFVFMAAVLGLVGLIRRSGTFLLAVIISLAVPAFQVYMYRQGTTFGFDRFYISVIPAAFVLYVLFVHSVSRLGPKVKTAVISILLLGLAASTGLTLQGIYQQETRTPEGTILRAAMQWQVVDNYAVEAEVASYIKSHVEGRQVLADASYADVIILFTEEPKLFVQTLDRDFDEALRDPVGKVKYILTRSPEAMPEFTGFNAVADRYPSLWESGTAFTRLEKDFGRYRLFLVVPPGTAGARTGPAGGS